MHAYSALYIQPTLSHTSYNHSCPFFPRLRLSSDVGCFTTRDYSHVVLLPCRKSNMLMHILPSTHNLPPLTHFTIIGPICPFLPLFMVWCRLFYHVWLFPWSALSLFSWPSFMDVKPELFWCQAKKPKRFHLICLKELLKIKWQDKIPDTEVLARAVMMSLHSLLKNIS